MAKLETPAAVPAALRPPRPAAVRMGAAIPPVAPAAATGSADDQEDGPEVIEVFEVEDYEPAGSTGRGASAAGLGSAVASGARAGGVLARDPLAASASAVARVFEGQAASDGAVGDELLMDEAITERGFDASTFGLPRSGATQVPIANLEMPTGSRLDLTPSPVPRVALSPATGAVDISLVPGPHASRNLPTLAAHHALGRRPVRRPAAAITFPPPRRGAPDASRARAGLAKNVRSSKHEIVLGLAIGLGLSLVLAGLGHAYLREAPVANAPAEIESLTLSARPEAPPAEGSSPGLAAQATAAAERPAHSVISSAVISSAAASASAGPDPAVSSGAASRGTAASGAAQVASAAPGSSVPATRRRAPASSDGAPSALVASAEADGVPPRAVAHATSPRAHARRADAQPVARAGASSEPAPARSFEEPPPTRTPLQPALSPAESAGLGLDLPL